MRGGPQNRAGVRLLLQRTREKSREAVAVGSDAVLGGVHARQVREAADSRTQLLLQDHALQAIAEMSDATPSSGESCMQPGCNKPRAPGYQHCCREHAVLPKPIAPAPATSSKCMLAGCERPQSAGYEFCCRDHVLEARKRGPPCALPGCSKPAFFDPKRNEVVTHLCVPFHLRTIFSRLL